MKIRNFFLPSLALGTAALLLAPAESVMSFTTIGGSLSAEGYRDVRVYNNFVDAQANNNTTIHANWPGWDGAEAAIWKGSAEWGSEVFGDGTGDSLQTVGSGGANFDAYWCGNADGVGGTNDNIVSSVGSCSSGVLAYTETPISNGWRIRFCDNAWTWQDGPGNDGSWDIQGIHTHEYGHALGLGHTTVSGSTMYASASPPATSLRSIEADDIAGVQYIYGVKSAGKPKITAVSIVGTTVTITGVNFSATNNEVRFTQDLPTAAASDPHLRVTGVSSTGGGTQIVVTAPGGSGPGNVMVKQNATGHSTLSNAYPIDLAGTPPPDPVAAFTGTPTSGNAPLFVGFTDQSTGTGIYAWSWTFGDGGTSAFQHPGYTYTNPGTFTVSLTVTGTLGSDTETKVGYIVVGGGGAASATWRNGLGVNPDIYDSLTLPILGTTWQSQIDASGLGATGLTLAVGYSAPFGGFVGSYGELLIDPSSSWAFTSLAFLSGGIANHNVAIPSDPAFVGVGVSVQSYLNSYGPSGQLTNAWDLILGY
ncbi:MAG: matrixin family metalloprotease [Planctomycetota bacterium]